MVSVSVVLVWCIWADACSALLTSKQFCAYLKKLFHDQAWENLVTIKCWMWLRGKIAKSAEHGLGSQSQVSTLLSQPGKPKCIFFPAWSGMIFTEIIFLVFLCSPFYSTSNSLVLLCSFLQHLHLTLPFSWWPLYINYLISCWPDSALNCSFARADLSNVFN